MNAISARIRAAAKHIRGFVGFEEVGPAIGTPLAAFLDREADRAADLEASGLLDEAGEREVLTPELLELVAAIEQAVG